MNRIKSRRRNQICTPTEWKWGKLLWRHGEAASPEFSKLCFCSSFCVKKAKIKSDPVKGENSNSVDQWICCVGHTEKLMDFSGKKLKSHRTQGRPSQVHCPSFSNARVLYCLSIRFCPQKEETKPQKSCPKLVLFHEHTLLVQRLIGKHSYPELRTIMWAADAPHPQLNFWLGDLWLLKLLLHGTWENIRTKMCALVWRLFCTFWTLWPKTMGHNWICFSTHKQIWPCANGWRKHVQSNAILHQACSISAICGNEACRLKSFILSWLVFFSEVCQKFICGC